jgi:hypothetical protein
VWSVSHSGLFMSVEETAGGWVVPIVGLEVLDKRTTLTPAGNYRNYKQDNYHAMKTALELVPQNSAATRRDAKRSVPTTRPLSLLHHHSCHISHFIIIIIIIIIYCNWVFTRWQCL